MNVHKYLPETLLEPYINSILITDSDVDFTNNLLPGTAPVLVFRLKGAVYIDALTIPQSGITGMSRGARQVRYTAQSGVLLVLFKEGGAAAFTDIPLHEFSGVTTDLANVFPAAALREIRDCLDSCRTDYEKVAEIQKFLSKHLKTSREEATIDKAVQLIRAQNGSFKIGELVSKLNTNIDSFEKKFRARVGISPKNYSSIIRMHSAIDSYQPGSSLTDVSLSTGFFDQAHFSREFKAFTGQSPTAFFKGGPKKW